MMKFASLALLATLAACSGGGSGGSDSGTGSLSVVLTDSATDELTQFEVDVRDIVFRKVGGATVSVMPRTTRVDFLQLESIGELVAARDLEAGRYDRITMTLDFAGAEVFVAGSTTAATVLDPRGNAISGTYDVDIDLTTGARPFLRANRRMLLVLDLDLEQSLTVDAGANAVTFAPVWSVEADPETPKPVATTGILQSFDGARRLIYVERRAPGGELINTFAVQATVETIFQLGGVVRIGDFGLGSLVDHLGQRIFVQGRFDRSAGRLVAAAVETGSGVPGNGQDWVYGHVVARSGGAGGDATLTVIGRSRDVSSGTRTYNTLHTVDVSFADTKVLRRGVGAAFGTDAINVGQRVWIFGDLAGTSLDATATSGVARMLKTSIFGVANGPVSGDVLSLDLERFGRRDVTAFDFDVSGQVQADADAFTVDMTGLSTGSIDAASRVRVFGWIGEVGGVGADAEAVSFVDRTNGPKLLFVRWASAADGVLDATGAGEQVALDVSSASRKVVLDGFAPTTLADSPAPTIEPLRPLGLYRIVERGSVTLYTRFTEFEDGITARTADSAVRRVSAFGTFASGTQTLSALSATVVLD